MKSLHGVEFTEEEKEIIERIGKEKEDYAICALFDYRNEDTDIEYNEESGAIKLIKNGHNEVVQAVEMITDVAETDDPMERIGVGVSMLEVAFKIEQKF